MNAADLSVKVDVSLAQRRIRLLSRLPGWLQKAIGRNRFLWRHVENWIIRGVRAR